MKSTRRAVLLGTSAAILAGPVRAQGLPKQIRLVVPYSPGGGADTTARLIQPKLQDALGVTVVIDNRPGAAGMIGDEVVAKATADGGTLLLGAFAHAVNPLIQPKMPFRTPEDFAPVSLLTSTTTVTGWSRVLVTVAAKLPLPPERVTPSGASTSTSPRRSSTHRRDWLTEASAARGLSRAL